jgi:hypothetical protein
MKNDVAEKKWLYKFSHTGEINGEKVTKNFAILKPGRKLREAGDIFYSSEVSRFAKAGVLPRAAWNTILSNGGGSISDSDRENYGKLLVEFRNKSLDTQRLILKGVGSLTEEEKKELEVISAELEEIKNSIQAFEADQVNIFENTAESKARNKAILWWTCNLAYQQGDNNSFSVLMPGESFEKQLDWYDSLEQESSDQFTMDVLSRIVYLIALWFMGKASKDEDFKLYDPSISKAAGDNLPDAEDGEINKDDKGSASNSDTDESFIPEKLGE